MDANTFGNADIARNLARLDKRNTVQTNIEATGILKDLGIPIGGDVIVSPDYTNPGFERLQTFIEDSDINSLPCRIGARTRRPIRVPGR